MRAPRLQIAVVLGILIPRVVAVGVSSDCLAAVDDCLSNVCKSQQAIYSAVCGDEDCQLRELNACNLTIRTATERRCVCNWEEEGCGSVHALATQCHRPTVGVPDPPQRRHLTHPVDAAHAGSCLDRLTACVGDAFCNRHLVPVLQACKAGRCDEGRCRRATAQFYGSIPQSVAETLVTCECEASDHSCVQMRRAVQGSACSDEAWVCQKSVVRCAEEAGCRERLSLFQSKCWSSAEDDGCRPGDGCLPLMDPELLLGEEPECRKAFVATLGTVLHHPCSCNGVHNDHALTCARIHDVLHNRSLFTVPWQGGGGPLTPPKVGESGQNLPWPHRQLPDYLLYAVATVLLVGVLVFTPLALLCKIRTTKRRNEKLFHALQESNSVVLL